MTNNSIDCNGESSQSSEIHLARAGSIIWNYFGIKVSGNNVPKD